MCDLRDSVNGYVRYSLSQYMPTIIKSPKVIHDSILGTNAFFPHEIMVIDSPLIQRLRRISQVDVVPLVFPSGNHTRFEHSLGVTVIADRLVKALADNVVQTKDSEYQQDLLHHVRMAAILHDCGHGPFSHMSEDIYGEFDDFTAEKNNNRNLFGGAKPHEILSYLIVTSPAFTEFYSKYIEPVTEVRLDFELIGQMIIGNTSNKEKAFWVEIINGAFDADKLDYIQRDSHFTGIQMILDLDRLFHCLDLIEINGKRRLTVDYSGVSTLEQIVFDKMMLVNTVYKHHKVRSAELIFSSIFDEIITQQGQINERKFNSAADFLYLTDDDIYNLAKNEKTDRASVLAKSLVNRSLPKRCLIISRRTIDKNIENLVEIMSLNKAQLKDLAFLIANKANDGGSSEIIDPNHIWIDIPSLPTFKEATQWPIKSPTDPKQYETLREAFPIDDWSTAYSQNKWKGHVFTWPKYTKRVNQAATEVFQEVFDITLKEASRTGCKLD